jgi:hypothetical protein
MREGSPHRLVRRDVPGEQIRADGSKAFHLRAALVAAVEVLPHRVALGGVAFVVEVGD